MTTRDYHVEQLDDERILENFLTCFRDLDKSNTDQCKYVLRLRSIIAGTARTIVIELDDLRIFSKNEANHHIGITQTIIYLGSIVTGYRQCVSIPINYSQNH